MSKNSVEIKKRDELKVLDALEQHANDSISELGQRCSFSSQKIAKIIKNLEKKKLIWGYTTVADAEEKNHLRIPQDRFKVETFKSIYLISIFALVRW